MNPRTNNEPHHRYHDFLEAIQRFETSIKLMERGFDFTTPEGCRMVSQLKESLDTLKIESKVLKDLCRDR